MTWLHPWAIVLGGFASGIPVAVHFLTRPRPARLPLSTIRFVREAIQQRRAWHWLRDLIVLALRTLAVLLVALTVARLQIGEQPLVAAGDTHDAVRVLILDVSQSMAAGRQGIPAFERARSVAAKYLGYGSGLAADVILAGATAQPVLERPTANLAALREELARTQPRPERLNVQAALNRAAEMLTAARLSTGARRELIVVSDFQRTNWVTADFSALPDDTLIQLESVASDEPPPNLGLLRVECQGRAEPGRAVRLEVDLGNYTPAPRRATVQVRLGDLSYTLERLCPPGVITTLAQEVELRGLGWQAGEARLVGAGDALAADDVRPFTFEVRRAPSYALLTRQPASARPSSSYFLERALVPVPSNPNQPGPSVTRIDPIILTREMLVTADLIVLDHPGKLSPEAIELLSSLMRRGRSVLYVAAEPLDATNLKLLADAAGTGLQMPVEFAPAPAGQPRRDLFLAEVRRAERPWNVFGDDLPAVISPLRFSGGLSSRQMPSALQDDVLATYSDRSACLIATTCDVGSLAVLNADLSSSNLHRSPAFVPFVGELVERLLEQRRGAGVLQPGEPFAAYLPPDAYPATSLAVVSPHEGGPPGDLVEEATGVLWRMRAAGPPGIFRINRNDTTLYAAASALAPQESDLRPIEMSVLTERLAGGRKVHYRSATNDAHELDDRWSWFAVGCVACLLAEVLALRGFQT